MLGNDNKLEIKLFGGMVWSFGGKQLPTTNKKLCALVAYLCLNGITKQTRERLVGLLWSEVNESKARASLRQTIKQLKDIADDVGFKGLKIERDSVEIDSNSFSVDLTKTFADLENAIVNPLLLETDNVCETILKGFEDLDSDFRIWVLATRENNHQKMLRTAERLFIDPRTDEAISSACAEAVLKLDPTYEPACRYLMHYRAETGDTAGAIKIYNTLWNYLSDEYDMEPSDETIELIAAIKSGSISLKANTNVPAPKTEYERPRYFLDHAVLPVVNIERFEVAGIPDYWFHLVRGFRHSLVDSLARFREWKVADDVLLSPSNSDEAEVVYTMQCTAYIADGDLHLLLTMKDLFSNVIIWSDRFSHDLHSWTDIHHRILSKIAMALNVQLSAQKLSEILSSTEISGKVYDQWLLGQSLIMNFDSESWSKAENIFQSLISQVPEFAPAFSSLVQLGNTRHIAQPGLLRSQEIHQNNLLLAQKATQLDPVDSRAHLSLAWAYAYCEQFDSSYPHFKLAVELNGYDPWTIISAAQGFAFLGDTSLAADYGQFSLKMSYLPSPPYWGYHAGINFMCCNYQKSLANGIQAGDALVNNGIWRAASYFHLGDIENAKREINHCYSQISHKWINERTPNPDEITNWLIQLFPIQSAEDSFRLYQVLDLGKNTS